MSSQPVIDRLRDEARRAKRMAASVLDPLTEKLLTKYAEECEETADRLVERQGPPDSG
jgi:hypothetical protein